MITEMDIKKRLIELMATKWPKKKYRYYLREVYDAYRMPCFFILVDLDDESPSGAFVVEKSYTIRIEYWESGHKEEKTAEIVDGMRELFLSQGNRRYFTLHIDDRYLEVRNFNYDYVGSRLEVPEISFRLEFFDSYAVEDKTEKMQQVTFKETLQKQEV